MTDVEVPTLCKLMQKAGKDLGKTLMQGKIEGKRRSRQQRIWLDSISNSMDMNLSKFWEIVRDREVWNTAIHGVTELGTI